MLEFFRTLLEPIAGTLGNLVIALVIVVGGWLIALAIRALVRGILKRITLDNRIATMIAGDEAAQQMDIETWLAQIVYYLIMVFVAIAALNQLNLTAVAAPLQTLLDVVLAYIPRLIGAGIIIFVAWLIATAARFLIRRLFDATNIDDRLSSQAGIETGADQVSVSHALAETVYWFIFLLFLPAVLGALDMQGLLGPVQALIDQVLGYIPNILAAAFIFLIGWVIARIVRQITVNLLAAAGFNRLGERIGLDESLGGQTLSGLVGLVIYTLIMLIILIAALNALNIAAISGPAILMLELILAAVPAVVAALILLAVAYYLGRLVAEVVTNLLTGIGFNRILAILSLGGEPVEGQMTPSQIVGYVVHVAVVLSAIAASAELLGWGGLTAYMGAIIAFLSQLILALIIFAIGLFLANMARSVVRSSSDSTSANILSQVAWLAIVFFTGALALGQSGLSAEIINIAFLLTLGALAVAMAIAFGIGGREVAAREIERFVGALRDGE
jgi:hypothetical protein